MEGAIVRDQLGYAAGLVTTMIMAIDAATTHQRGADRVDAIVAHGFFAALPVAALLLLRILFPARTSWAFLVSAVVCVLAGVRGLDQFWVYALGFAVAGVIGVWTAWQTDDDAPRRPREFDEGHAR